MKALPKAYEPGKYEEKLYQAWEKSGCFNPDKLPTEKSAPEYSIMMPPPNVTGVLHLGHALENTIMDIEIRYQRMQGKKALLLPGTDHAAVATQARVEKGLIAQGIEKPRETLGREKLLEKIRDYAEKSKATILTQIRKMGTSCDWSRLAYTFDEERSLAVNEIFIRMFNDGLIYRGYRVVNWSVKGQSTCSDDELVHEERKTTLYTFKYSKDFPIPIATTRPETKLGDTAVAVNPDDKRYQEYIGKTFTFDLGAKNPLQVNIIADKEIDPAFGTGAVGVTPAHSQVDYDMYLRHNLNLIEVIGPDGKMTGNAGKEYQGLSTEEARKRFIQFLRTNDLMISEEEITHNVGTSDRFGDVVEILPMQQWFVAVNKKIPGKGKTLKDLMREAVTSGLDGKSKQKITIVPDRFNDTYLRWIDNLRDWCISRQIWWGHRIPVWYREKPGAKETEGNDVEMYAGTSAPAGEGWVQDPDTLDTWFSSGTWTFSTLGWPEKTTDLQRFHPTSWMQMGHEILFFWMARMILMSTYALDEIPFKQVYIHGILRDKQGRKFSKSLGNGIDPIEVIKMYGTDALRLSLTLGISPGNDSRFYEEKVEGSRNFINKLWNISRYILEKSTLKEIPQTINSPSLSLADKWILQKLDTLIAETTDDLEHYRFSMAGEKLKEFTWNHFADWYIEVTKTQDKSEEILLYVLDKIIRLWHPIIPFVTEEIYQSIKDAKGKEFLMVEKWPHPADFNFEKELDAQMTTLQTIITETRHVRSIYHIAPGKQISLLGLQLKEDDQLMLADNQPIIEKLTRSNLSFDPTATPPKKSAVIVVGKIKLFIDLEDLVDMDKETARLKKEKQEATQYLDRINSKLKNKAFVSNAPKELVAQEEKKAEKQKEKISEITKYLKNLN